MVPLVKHLQYFKPIAENLFESYTDARPNDQTIIGKFISNRTQWIKKTYEKIVYSGIQSIHQQVDQVIVSVV